MNAVVVTGISMRPFLISGDLLLVKDIESPIPFGSLVLAKNKHDEQIVHRYLGIGKVKGDRIKYWDEIKSIDYLILARVEKEKKYDLQKKSVNLTLALLSYFNQKKFFIIHHFSAGLISLFGRWGRNGN